MGETKAAETWASNEGGGAEGEADMEPSGDAGCSEAAPKICPAQGRSECLSPCFHTGHFLASWVLITRSINMRLLLPALAQAF